MGCAHADRARCLMSAMNDSGFQLCGDILTVVCVSQYGYADGSSCAQFEVDADFARPVGRIRISGIA